jgi:hypothetical protein
MLLQAGLSFRRLLLLSFVSGALGLGGAALGVGLSFGPAPLTPWVFGVTSGVFLYVALVDMVRSVGRTEKSRAVGGGCGGEESISSSTSTTRSLDGAGPQAHQSEKPGMESSAGGGRLLTLSDTLPLIL